MSYYNTGYSSYASRPTSASKYYEVKYKFRGYVYNILVKATSKALAMKAVFKTVGIGSRITFVSVRPKASTRSTFARRTNYSNYY